MLLTGRLAKRLRDLGLTRFQDYLERVVGDRSGAELIFLLDAITTSETHFFVSRGSSSISSRPFLAQEPSTAGIGGGAVP